MSAGARRWMVRLTAAAESDFRDIVRWTLNEFGERQAHTYSRTLSAALSDLTAGPSISGVRRRDDIAKGLFTLHVTRNRRRGRHFVTFRIVGVHGREVIEVLRLLHDAMDLPRHVEADDLPE